MASRVMVDGLASWKAALQQKQTEMEVSSAATYIVKVSPHA